MERREREGREIFKKKRDRNGVEEKERSRRSNI